MNPIKDLLLNLRMVIYMSKVRECYLCGKKYKYCPSCSQDRMKPSWMAEFHEENCKNIFDICTRYNMQMLTKSEAKKALEACDLSNKENFKDYVQRDIASIFAEDPKPVVKPAAPKAEKISEVVKQENE